ncbi:hypothetical protein GCK32_013962 [Trichostrongylus colubriformis]|uniref:Uncharacterized protein n=1 Tax=Trichostrongylus colubriformis TaxID=6319 RepID=A0AAN8IIF2_TRICO
MEEYKYFLLNIEVSAYVETMFYSFLMSMIWMNPYFGVNADGFLWMLFRVPTKYAFSQDSLVAKIFGHDIARDHNLTACGTPNTIQISNRALKIIILIMYIVSVGISLPLATMAWQEHNESVALIRTIDPDVYLGDSFILLGGPTVTLWIYYATALAASSFVIYVVITVAITTTACIPVLMLCLSFYIGESLVTSTDAYVWTGGVMSSMKSFSGTLAMIAMTTCYRFSKRTFIIIIVFIYMIAITTLVPLSILSFKANTESAAEVKKIDPYRDLGENFALIDGPIGFTFWSKICRHLCRSPL